MQVIDQINGSALFAQSAYSASVATKDSLGRDITATYLTGINIPESGAWNEATTTLQTNSGVWNDKLDVSSLDLEIGQSFVADPSITGAYRISGAYILALNAYRDSLGRPITGWYQLKDYNLLSGTKYGTLRIDNENTHLVDTTFSALSSYEGVIVSAIPASGVSYYTHAGYQDTTQSTTSHSYDNVKSYSINLQSWDGGFTAQINGVDYDHSYFDGNHTITGEFNSPSTLVISLYRSNNYMQPQINQFDLSVEGQINEVVDIRNVFATNEQLNTASSFLSGAIDYVSANAGGNDLVHKSDFTFVSDQWGTYLQKVSGKYIDYATRAGQAELDQNGHAITAQYLTTANANILSSMLSGAIDYVSANVGGEFPISADEAIQYVQTNSAGIDDTITNVTTNSGAWGGSALPISAGPGVKLQLVNNTLVVSNDETLLWSGYSTGSNPVFSLADDISSFNFIEFYAVDDDGWCGYTKVETDYCTTANRIATTIGHYGLGDKNFGTRGIYVHPTSNTSMDAKSFGFDYVNACVENDRTHMTKIIGINRK